MTSSGSRPRGGGPGPSDVMRDSEFHRRFLEHTLGQRDDASGRALLDAEWHYLETLLGARSREPLDVLDLACGSGHQALAWVERGFRVAGLDFDRELLLAGRERVARASGGRRSVRWVCGDATRVPFANASFDVVFCNSLLEHVPDWRAALAEAARVLRPRGVVVVFTTNRTCPIQQEVNGFPFYSWLPDPIQRRVLAWIMEHRRDMVNYTDFPAVNWFTFGGMRKAFKAVGLDPYDRLDLLARRERQGARGRVAAWLSRGGILKLPYYFYVSSMAMYGVRRELAVPAPPAPA